MSLSFIVAVMLLGIAMLVVASFGLAVVVGFSYITEAPRVWLATRSGRGWRALGTLLECPLCFGVWEGAGIGFLLPWALGDALLCTTTPCAFSARLALIMVLAFFIAGSNFLLGRATGLISVSH